MNDPSERLRRRMNHTAQMQVKAHAHRYHCDQALIVMPAMMPDRSNLRYRGVLIFSRNTLSVCRKYPTQQGLLEGAQGTAANGINFPYFQFYKQRLANLLDQSSKMNILAPCQLPMNVHL